MMESDDNLQDVLRCHLCDTPIPQLYCDLCQINLCASCVGVHILDGCDSKKHNVRPMTEKWYPNPVCSKHSARQCDLYCNTCHSSICTLCVISGEHDMHKKVEIFQAFQNTLDDLVKNIYPRHQKVLEDIKDRINKLKQQGAKLTDDLNNHGKALHREIDKLIWDKQCEIDDKVHEQLAFMEKEEVNITIRIDEIEKTIRELGHHVKSREVQLVSQYTKRISIFNNLSIIPEVSLPRFSAGEINKEQLEKQFGTLTYSFDPFIMVNHIPKFTNINEGMDMDIYKYIDTDIDLSKLFMDQSIETSYM